MEPVIFLEKIRRPGPRGLVRDRLEAATATLRAGTPGPLTSALVLGPPGCGKTTLLSQLAARDVAVGWYRAGREDGDAATVTRYLGHALATALQDPGLAAAASGGAIGDLIGELDGTGPRPAMLFIDDLQELAGTPAERTLETLLAMRPREITIVLGSRRAPSMNTSRLVVSEELLEIDSDDLRFRSWEVEQLFRVVYDAPLSPEGAAALTRRTGGWAAGLHLFHLATEHCGRAERERAIGELGGRSRLIRSYLARNVLGSVDARRLDFLIRTATLGVLTGDLCDQLLGVGGSAAVLVALEDEQFFTTSTDGGVTYRYHHVLQTQLELSLVDQLGGRAARELYQRSGELLERDARTGAAVRAYARAEDWGSVARLLTVHPESTEQDAVSGLLALPGVPTDDPCLAVAGARLLARRGRLAEAIAGYHRAEGLLDDRPFNERCRRERRSLQLWLPDAVVPAVPAVGGVSAVSAELRTLTRTGSAAVTTPLSQGLQLLLTGRLDEAVHAFGRAAPGDGWQAIAGRLAEQVALLLRDDDPPDAGRVEAILLDAELDGWPWLARVAHGVQLAALLVSAGEEWTASALELLESLRCQDDPWTDFITSVALGVGFARAGQQGPAADALGHAGDVADVLTAPALRAWTDRLAAAIARPAGDERPFAVREPDRGRGAAPPPVALTCLGRLGLTVAGREVDHLALRPRARSLLMLLALHHQRPVHREYLIEQLWPDSSLASGVRCLQVAVSSIRQCLQAAGLSQQAVVREGDAYALRIAGTNDLDEFERLIADAARGDRPTALRLRCAALAVYAGDLFPEAGPAEWVVGERDRLRRLAGVTATAAAADALAGGDPHTALECAHRAIALDQYQDSAWSLIADSNALLGNHAAAAVARREHTRMLAELGLTR